MCGRYVTADTASIVDLFQVDDVGPSVDQTFNARPLFEDLGADEPRVPLVVESVRDGERRRRCWPGRWPFTPSWSKTLTMKRPTFNAVAETVTQKPMWRDAVAGHRAIFPALGYYETLGSGKRHRRFYFHDEGDVLLALAGIFSWWRAAPQSEWILTGAILTIDAPGEAAAIHNRAPLVLPAELWDDWLDPGITAGQGFIDAAAQKAASAVEELAFHEVGLLDENSVEMIAPRELT
ncbi:SOS response-associated peptidase [Brooklawnia sp.]|uniref:SOS response-associated peptidase n=1 Tax=Brooklawnia sp. TaxID=2699740 RepID=UPI00311DDA77